jgi:hypothetical protein
VAGAGVYAYFEYVREDENRAALQRAWEFWLEQGPQAADKK